MPLTDPHRKHIKARGFSDQEIDQLEANGLISSLSAAQIQADWLDAFPAMRGNEQGAILLRFNATTHSLRPDEPPLDEKADPCKYLYQYGGDDPKGTHTQPWNPPGAVAATEGLFDALVATYLIGIPCSAATAPSHLGRSEFSDSVRCYFSDADVPFHHNHSLLPMVVGLCRRKGLKLAHLPRNPNANYAYTTQKIPNDCKWGAEEWNREWLRLGSNPKVELQKIVDSAAEPVQYLQAVFQDYQAAGLRYPKHADTLRSGAAAIADATDDKSQRIQLRDRLAVATRAPKTWIDEIVQKRQSRIRESQQPSEEQQEQLSREQAERHQQFISQREREQPFDVLGWNKERDRIHYRCRETGQVAALKLGGQNDLVPATGTDWLKFFLNERGLPNWLAIQGEIRRQAQAAGVFEYKSLRGRGVYVDQGRFVVHLGDRLEVDGVITNITGFITDHIYELLKPLDFDPSVEPLSDKESKEILQISKDCGWTKPADHLIFAGWIVSAPICGVLPKRPPLQIKKNHGKGKSYRLDKIVRPLLAGTEVIGTGCTPAFIRQELGHDRRPVLIDESEQSRNPVEAARRRDHLLLARYAFDGTREGRGSQSGDPISYELFSSFCLSGINAEIGEASTRSRFFELTFEQLPEAEWQAFASRCETVITPLTGHRLLRRTINSLKVIRKNLSFFYWWLGCYGINGREREKLALMLACAYSLTSTEPAFGGTHGRQQNKGEAQGQWRRDLMDWLKENGFRSDLYLANSKQEKERNDSEKCLDYLLTREVYWQQRRDLDDTTPSTNTITIYSLLEIVSGPKVDGRLRDVADEALGRHGIRLYTYQPVDGPERLTVAVANPCEATEKVFGKSEWHNGAYKQRLLELECTPKVIPSGKALHFKGAGGPKRAVLVPIEAIFPDADGATNGSCQIKSSAGTGF